MLSKNESNHSQRSTHTSPEEAKTTRDSSSDALLNNPTKTGTSTLIHFFIMRFSFFLLLLFLIMIELWIEERSLPTLLAWARIDNNISIIELETKQALANFDGVLGHFCGIL